MVHTGRVYHNRDAHCSRKLSEVVVAKGPAAVSLPSPLMDYIFPAIGAVVLAAGRSQRMQALGTPKQLLPLGGRPLLTYAVATACASLAAPVIVVLGAQAGRAQAALDEWAATDSEVNGHYQCVVNPDFAQGMAGSLRLGLAALRERAPTTPGALIALADQPLVTRDIFDALLAAAQANPDAIVAASYDGQRGHPIIFPRALFDELAAVTGDEGGRSVIAHHTDRLRLVAIADARAALDVDRPEDYAAIGKVFGD